MVSTPHSIKIESLSRFSSIPIVSSAISLATDGYSRIKSYNGLISATLSRAEQSIIFMALTAKPVIEKFEKPISIADNIACQGLDKLQEKVPAIKKSPEELKDETKKLFEGSIGDMRKYSTDKLQGMKDYGYTKVNGVFDSPYIKAFFRSIDTAIDLTHNAVDHYLPAAANEPRIDEQTEHQQTLVVRMSHLSDKMRRRMYNQFSSKWVPMFVHRINTIKSNVLHWVQHNPSQETSR